MYFLIMKTQRSILKIYFIILLINCASCKKTKDTSHEEFYNHSINHWNWTLTDVIIQDIFTPPVASRAYAYPHIAAYEILILDHPSYRSYAGQLNGFTEIPLPADSIFAPLSAMVAFAEVAKGMVFLKDAMEKRKEDFLHKAAAYHSETLLKVSVLYGKTVAEHILHWANDDGYRDRERMPRYVLSDDPGAWQPTPPDFMPGIEPHWSTLRPFVLNSADQFKPLPPTLFDTLSNSDFYYECLEVKNMVDTSNEEMTNIAKFWDCNPNISYTRGHMKLFFQKISPGGHWMSIASIASMKENISLIEKSRIFSLAAIAMADAFISCWDEKYRSNLIRPQTYINRYIDEDWEPLLQTPAFPEHTSGHSVVSATAATILTELMGEINFTDTTEVRFGLPERSYDSFYEASNEAAISRLYGGIHYRPAIEYGIDQGKSVANYILSEVKTK